MRVIPPLNKVEDFAARLIPRSEGVSIEQLAFECRKEALTQRVVIGIPDGSHGGPHSCFTTPLPESQASQLVRISKTKSIQRCIALVGAPLVGQY